MSGSVRVAVDSERPAALRVVQWATGNIGAAGRLDAGTIAAQRITVSGVRSTRFRANWYCTAELDPAQDTGGR